MENKTIEPKLITENPNYEFVESKHTTKGTILYVLKLKNKIEDKFNIVNKRVEKRGGYWSSQQRGFVFKRILEQPELNEIFKGIFFEEKIATEKIDENKDAWIFTVNELMEFPYQKREDNTFVFKYMSNGNKTSYSIKVPSGSHEDAVKHFANQIISNALIGGKYNLAVSKGDMKPERAVIILKGIDSSLLDIEEDFNVQLHPNIRALWNAKKSNEKEINDKLKYPFLFESTEMPHLSKERYSKIIYDALSSGKYDSLIKDGVVSANKVAFIIESAGFEIPEDIISEAIYERRKEVESIVGGFADAQSIFDISEKHGVSIKEIMKQFRKGIKVEREHTKDKKKMGEIVKDHLWENPLYYDVLIDAEKAMEEVSIRDFKTNDEYLQAIHDQQKKQEQYSDEEKAFFIARPIIDRIKHTYKKIESGVPEEVEAFLRNEILNQFSILFKDVVSKYIVYTPIWLDLQLTYLTKKQQDEMLMFGIYNVLNYDVDAVSGFIENVVNSEIPFGNNKVLNNVFDLIPINFQSEVPANIEFELNPKDKGLASLLDKFVIKGKILSQNMGVYFTRGGVFASNFNLDIFIKGKKGYLSKLNIEEGIYGMSENAKDIFPIYGNKRLPMLINKSHVDFFKKYIALYGNEKKNLTKSTSLFTNDEIIQMYKNLSIVYNSKAYKQYLKKDVVGFNPLEKGNQKSMKFVKTTYPILYLKMKDKFISVSFDDIIDAVYACIKMDMDTVQIATSENSIYISENVSAFLGIEETGIRVKVRGSENVIPQGVLYFDLYKKEFYTNKLVEEKKEVEDKKEQLQKSTLDELKVRARVLEKMIAKNPENKSELEVRMRVINKMIAKLSGDSDTEEMEAGGTVGDSSQFKVISFDLSDYPITNGMVNRGNTNLTYGVGRFNGEEIELKDGTTLPVVKKGYFGKDIVYSGWIIDLYPYPTTIKDAEYKGKKVVSVELNYSKSPRPKFEFENGQPVSFEWIDIQVEGVKRKYTVQYFPKDYTTKVFVRRDYLDLDKEFVFNDIKIDRVGKWHDSVFSFNYAGGGYGEKYYLTSAYLNVGEFIKRYLNNYLSKEFRDWIEYGNYSETPDWINILTKLDNWEIEVEYVQYEGYEVSGYEFKKSALSELNKSLSEHISKFKGKTKIDWKDIDVPQYKKGGLFDSEMGIEKSEPIKPSLSEVNQLPKSKLKKINVNNYVWYLDPIKMIVYENEDGTGSSLTVFRLTTQEREQVYDQMFHDKPMITHP